MPHDIRTKYTLYSLAPVPPQLSNPSIISSPAACASFERTIRRFLAHDERERMTNGHFIKAVRLMKYLRDFKNTFECKSIILMTLLGNQVNVVEASYTPELYGDVPSTLVTLLGKLANTLPTAMPTIMDPAQTGENFTDRYGETWNYGNFRAWMTYYMERMRDAHEEEDVSLSIAKWRRVFGDKFKPGVVIRKALHAPSRRQFLG